MGKTDKDILTTAETAKILGVSVRTAQLLIEGGSVPSWKTPGGHRRVYRADVMGLIERPVPGAPVAPPASATVIIVAPTERLTHYDRLFAGIAECMVEAIDNVHRALFAIGSVRPYAIIVDLEPPDAERVRLLHSLSANPSLGHSRILAVAATGTIASADLPGRVVPVETAEQAAAAIRVSLTDTGAPIPPPGETLFPLALNESQRLVALERSGLLDTLPEEAFDRLTWLAARTLDAPIALLTLLTPTRQWFKSRIGVDAPETPRSWAFCNHTILQKGVFAVEDLSGDPRFAANPAVAGDLGFRFYAGATVHDNEGFTVGSLCVIDRRPRTLDDGERRALMALAALASDEVRLRSTERQLRDALGKAERQTPRQGHIAPVAPAVPEGGGRSHRGRPARGRQRS
ncbi:GAF domain-containing protein [Ancylobacter polymorphus]|uniref:Excisionase family DNA-binding protein n=1 Tax=Ancylobacter polymorphus TaxID=223390 RepID=A0A9E7A662_9HYPH|nr:GAF domain-containing protein [Ancylobacter polymorphus]UOK71494.1 excisionase family DNA-binding protein [Ancylobacter polymorphus]